MKCSLQPLHPIAGQNRLTSWAHHLHVSQLCFVQFDQVASLFNLSDCRMQYRRIHRLLSLASLKLSNFQLSTHPMGAKETRLNTSVGPCLAPRRHSTSLISSSTSSLSPLCSPSDHPTIRTVWASQLLASRPFKRRRLEGRCAAFASTRGTWPAWRGVEVTGLRNGPVRSDSTSPEGVCFAAVLRCSFIFGLGGCTG